MPTGAHGPLGWYALPPEIVNDPKLSTACYAAACGDPHCRQCFDSTEQGEAAVAAWRAVDPRVGQERVIDDGIVMSDAEIAEALVGCIGGDDYPGSYHRPQRWSGYYIENGVLYLGEGDDFYSYPITIDALRCAFNIRRPT